MKELFQEKRFDIAMLMLAALFPVYRSFTSVVMLSLFCLATLTLYYYLGSQQRPKVSRSQFKYFFITAGFYLMMVLSLTYTTDLKTGVAFLVSNVYLLIYPLMILLFVKDISQRHVDLILFSFLFACCLYAVYMHVLFFHAGLYGEFKRAEYNDLPFRSVLMENRGHPTYVSMWFFFSVLFLIHYLFTRPLRRYHQVSIVVISAFLIFSSVILSAKITILAFFFSLLVLIYALVKNKAIVTACFALLIAVFVFALFNVSFLKARFIDEFNATELKPPIGIATNSLNIRVGIYECSWNVFGNHWLVGTGIGDAQNELNECYNSFDTNVYKESTYNSHNNYFAIAISIGTIGLVIFLFAFGFHIVESIRFNNALFLVFLIFVMICLLPENILSRNHGVVFYSLFCGVFCKQNQQNVTRREQS